jgi:microcystin-dependent protein
MDNVSSQVSGSSSVLAADWNTYVRDNFDDIKAGHIVVADATARTALGVVTAGTMVFEASTNKLWVYTTSWFELGNFTQNTAVISGGGPYSPFFTPVGMVTPFASATAPTGWLLCDGSAKSTTTNPEYTALWGIIGTSFGGSGASSFNVPDLRGRTVVGVGAGTEITGVLGTVQGVKDVTLTASQSGTTAHGHAGSTVGTAVNTSVSDPGHVHNVGSRSNGTQTSPYDGALTGVNLGINGSVVKTAYTGIGVSASLASGTLTIVDSTAAAAVASHTNIQPSMPLTYIIKY